MLRPLLATFLTGAIYTALGLPLAWCRRSSRRSPATLLFDSLAVGLLLATCGVSAWVWLDLLGVVALVVLVAAAVAVSQRGRRADAVDAVPSTAAMRPQLTWWTVALAAIVAVAGLLRMRSVNFLAWVGDMGDYVNAANSFVRSGVLDLTFPPAFPSFLVLPAAIFGPSGTTDSVPLLGVVLVGAVLRVLGQLEVPPPARIATAVVVGASPLAIWFSSFPMSEAMQAPLLVVLLSAVLSTLVEDGGRGRRRPDRAADLVVVALAAAAAGLSRGTSPLLMVPMLAVVVVCLARRSKARLVAAADLAGVTLAGLGISYLHGIDRIPSYFVHAQIETILPARVFGAADRLRLFTPSWWLTGVIVLACAAFPVAGRLVARGWSEEGRTSPGRWPIAAHWPLALTALASLAAVAALAVEGPGEIRAQVGRIGLALVAFAALATLLPRAVSGIRATAVALCATTAVMMLVIQITRFDVERAHTYYVYWDRYLFSEVFPAVVLLAGIAAGALIETARAVDRRSADADVGRAGPLGRVASVGVVVLAVVLAGSWIGEVRLQTRNTLVDGAQRFDERLVAAMTDESMPILWSAQPEAATSNPIFPNTWFAFGMPLERTYGLDVANIDRSRRAFDVDLVVTRDDIEQTLACAGAESLYVIELERDGELLSDRVGSETLEVVRLDSVSEHISVLGQPATGGWREFELSADLWRVTADPDDLPACP